MIAVDTNVVVGAIQTFDPAIRAAARQAVKSLYRQGEELLCFPQNLVEFWSASTRPANANGLGFSPRAGRSLRGPISGASSISTRGSGNFPHLAHWYFSIECRVYMF